jgi:TonB family protein
MKPPLLPLTLALAAALSLLGSVANAQTQEGAASATSKTAVVLNNLYFPVYPPLARQARIMGDVTIQIHIRKDGKVESAEVVSGPAMLKQVALESAQKSQFECRGCSSEVTLYSLTYAFKIGDKCPSYGPKCESVEGSPAKVEQSQGRVEITVEPLCTCDPVEAITKIRVRSPKCMYLWKCGSRKMEPE